MHQLHLVTQQMQEATILHITGAMDSGNFATIAGLLNTHLKLSRDHGTIPQIVLECSQVTYIGSIELRALLDLANRARAHGGDVKCARLAPTIEQVVNLIANGDPLDCHPDVSFALEAFHTGNPAAPAYA